VAVAITAVLLAGCAGPAAPSGAPGTPGAPPAPTQSKTLTVLTHDSFALSESTIASFKASSGYDVTFVAPGDVGTLVNQLVLTKDAPLGDVVFGIDNTFAGRAIAEGVLTPYLPAGLPAGASGKGLEVFQQDWTAVQDASGSIHLHMTVRGAVLDLALHPGTPPVVFGEDGVSRKGADPSAASHYLSYPRLGASGTLRLPEGGTLAVQGLGWMDHEFSSNQLAPDQVGWDWAGIQLRDGRSLMVYRLRRGDGTQDPFSTLTEVDARGRLRRSTRAFTLAAGGAWRSPASGATYPLPLRLEAWGEAYSLVPILLDQELRTGRSTGITYWEGACRVLDGAGREVGEAYVELTGYAHSLKGRF